LDRDDGDDREQDQETKPNQNKTNQTKPNLMKQMNRVGETSRRLGIEERGERIEAVGDWQSEGE
jgi:hypothetical protein